MLKKLKEKMTAFFELIIKIGNSQDFQLLLIRITKYQLEKLKIKKMIKYIYYSNRHRLIGTII